MFAHPLTSFWSHSPPTAISQKQNIVVFYLKFPNRVFSLIFSMVELPKWSLWCHLPLHPLSSKAPSKAWSLFCGLGLGATLCVGLSKWLRRFEMQLKEALAQQLPSGGNMHKAAHMGIAVRIPSIHIPASANTSEAFCNASLTRCVVYHMLISIKDSSSFVSNFCALDYFH